MGLLAGCNAFTWVAADLPGVHAMQVVNQKMSTTFEGTYWEFVAKNHGVRRACGRYVLTTNADAYFTKGWWAQLAQRPYDEQHYFRLGRTATKNILPTEALDW